MTKPKTSTERGKALADRRAELNQKPQKFWVTDEEKQYLHLQLAKFRETS